MIKKVLMVIGAIFIGMIILGAIIVAGEDPKGEQAALSAPEQDSSDDGGYQGTTDEPEEDTSTVPEGRYGLASCDLGESDQTGLIGSTELTNTGDVPLTADVTFQWQLGDGSWIKADPKTVKVFSGKDKLVFFSMYADIDTQLSFQDHPEYFDGTNCKTKVKITG